MESTENSQFLEYADDLAKSSAGGLRGSWDNLSESCVKRGVASVRQGIVESIARYIEPPMSELGHDGLPKVSVTRGTRQIERVNAGWDRVSIWPHGLGLTHLDGPGHIGLDDTWYPHDAGSDAVWSRWARSGVLTRAVFVDVPGHRGVEFIEPSAPVTRSELEAIERSLSLTIEPGDALLLYCGRDRYEASHPEPLAAPVVAQDCASWIVDRRISVLCWDFADAPGHDIYAMGPHFLIWAIGLAIVDNCEFSRIVSAMRGREEPTALLALSPLPIAGLTGSVVNPLVAY